MTMFIHKELLLTIVLIIESVFAQEEFIDLRFITEPTDAIVPTKGRVTLPCRHNRQDAVYTWLYRGRHLVEEGEISKTAWSNTHRNGSITVKHNLQSPGYYRCRVTIPGFGTMVSREAHVQLEEFKILKTDGDEDSRGGGEKFVGDVAVLECQIKVVPDSNAVIVWFLVPNDGNLMQTINLENRDFVYHNDGRQLEIVSIGEHNFARYFCELRSRTTGVPVLSGDYIRVRPKQGSPVVQPLVFVARPQPATIWIQQGGNVSLVCAANGKSRAGERPKVAWLRADQQLQIDSIPRLSIKGQGSLFLTDLQPSDAGRYNCRISLGSKDRFAEVLLKIGVASVFKVQPTNVVGIEQQQLILPCEASGVPTPSIKWRKDGETLVHSEFINQQGGSLRISSLLPGDAGIFQCLASNRFGSLQSAVQLLVIKPSSSNAQAPISKVDRANTGDTSPTDSSNGLAPPTPLDLRAQVNQDFVHLTWSPGTVDTTPRPGGSRGTQPASSKVKYLIRISKKGQNRVLSLRTNSTGAILNTLVPNTTYKIRVFALSLGGTRSLTPAVVTVTTKEIVVRHSPVRNLNLEVVPELRGFNISWNHAAEGFAHLDRYELLLYNLSVPDQSQMNRPVNISVPANRNFVIVPNLVPDAFYRIYLYGVKGFRIGVSAKISSSPRVPSRPPSLPPSNTRVDGIGAGVVTIHWLPPPIHARNGEIIGYLITLSQNWIEPQTYKVGNVRQYTITDLSPDSPNRVTVAASTRAGTGPHSNPPIEFRTRAHPSKADQDAAALSNGNNANSGGAGTGHFLPRPDESPGEESLVPPGPVNDLRAIAHEHRIDLSWLPPGNGVRVTSYTVKWGRLYPGPDARMLHKDTLSYTISNLVPGSQYYVQVTAHNNMGEGTPAYKPVVTSSPSSDSALSIPMNLVVHSKGSNWALLRWEDPGAVEPSDGRIYQVKYSPVRGDRGREIVRNSTALTVRLDGLLPATRYEFTVRTLSPGKPSLSSGFSMVQDFDTSGQKPGDPPQDLTLSSVPEQLSSVHVSWQPPEHPNGRITSYVVHLTMWRENTRQQQGDEPTWVKRKLSGDTLNTVINSLQPEQVYLFRILGQNRHGESPLSPIRVFKTPKVNGKSGGPVVLSRDYYNSAEIRGPLLPNVQPAWDPEGVQGSPGSPNSGISSGDEGGTAGITDTTWWTIIGAVFGAAMLLIAFTFIAHYCCCRRRPPRDGYRAGNKMLGAGVGNNKHCVDGQHENGKVTPILCGQTGLKPPDLFIDTGGQLIEMERRNSDSVGRPSDADNDSVRFASVSQRHLSDGPGFSPASSSGGGGGGGYPGMHHQHHQLPPGHFIHPGGGGVGGGHHVMGVYPSQQQPQQLTPQTQHHRMGSLGQPIKPKPVMMQPPEQMGHGVPMDCGPGFGPGGTMGRGGGIPGQGGIMMLPPSGRGPLAHHLGGPAPPRVNASELASHTSSEDIRPLMQTSTLSEGRHSPSSEYSTFSQATVVYDTSTAKSSGSDSDRYNRRSTRLGGGIKQPGNPATRHSSKRKPPPGNNAVQKAMRHHMKPDVAAGANSSDPDLAKGYSTEELTQEMENLEGLMKDLNAITQKEFEC